MDKFFITTAIDYTNDVIHIGHAYQKILADTIARYHRQKGDKTYFLTGTDEHGQKVETGAKKNNQDPKTFVDKIAKEDQNEWDSLNISYDRFIRTTDPDHIKFAQEFYLKAKANGDIYLAKYEGLYCEGCEAYLTESDLVENKCPFHPNFTPQKITEENYFFALSKYQKFLENHIKKNPEFIWPESKRKEILAFIKGGLKDFSVSRQGVTWGIPVPDDPKHTIYVWFDALINYLTYGIQKNCWPADIHVLGKDNQRFHAIYWPAMLKSAGYELPKTILVHDFISLNGQKISKSLGNVIRPSELVAKFGVDGVRYYFLRFGPLTNDIDISLDKIADSYNSDLANGLGNLVSRVAKMATGLEFKPGRLDKEKIYQEGLAQALSDFRFDLALQQIWLDIVAVDKHINQNTPWLVKDQDKLYRILEEEIEEIRKIAIRLAPFLPETAGKIEGIFTAEKIVATTPLFPRI